MKKNEKDDLLNFIVSVCKECLLSIYMFGKKEKKCPKCGSKKMEYTNMHEVLHGAKKNKKKKRSK